MVVGCIRYIQVLGLVQYVVCLQGKGELVLEQEFGDFSIDHEFIILLRGVAVVPVVVGIRYQVHASRDGPVHGQIHLIVPCRTLVVFSDGVPGFGHPRASSEVDLHKVVPVGKPEPLGEGQGLRTGLLEKVQQIQAEGPVIGMGEEIPVEGLVIHGAICLIVIKRGKGIALADIRPAYV